MMIANEVLEIVDKNGFDWWGYKEHKMIWKTFAGKISIYWIDTQRIEHFKACYSLADFATNKSALDGVAKERILCRTSYSGNEIYLSEVRNNLQRKLISYLTKTKKPEPEEFFKICKDFIKGEM